MFRYAQSTKLYFGFFFSEPHRIANKHVVCCPLSLQVLCYHWCLSFFFKPFVASQCSHCFVRQAFSLLMRLVQILRIIYRLFPLVGHKLRLPSFRIQSCSVLSSIQEGMRQHDVGRGRTGVYGALRMMKPNTCMGPSPSGLSGLASTGQRLQSSSVGGRPPALRCSRTEDSFPLQSGPGGAPIALTVA